MPTLLPLLLACAHGAAAPPAEADVGDTGDTGVPTDTDTAPAMPWDAAGFWTEPGPLALLLDAELEDPGLAWHVRLATSADGVAWVEHEALVAGNFNSLDLFVTDVGVILLGLGETGTEPVLNIGSVYAIASADLETWSSHEWPIQGAVNLNLVDPSMHLRTDGTLGMTYYSCPEFGMDPVYVAGDHEVRRAVWDGERFAEAAGVALAEPGLVDPVICVLDGTEWLFATRYATSILTARGAGDGTFVGDDTLDWDARTVPSCRPVDGALEVLGQNIGGTSVPQVARMDGATLTDLGPLYAEHLWGVNNCSSPVLAEFREEYVLFCAVNVGMNEAGG